MGDNEAEGQQEQQPADDETQDAATGGPDTSTQGTGAPDTGGDSATPDDSDSTDDGGIDPKAIYGGG